MLTKIYLYNLEQVYTIDNKRINKRLVEVGKTRLSDKSSGREHDYFARYFILEDCEDMHKVYNLANEFLGAYTTEQEAESLLFSLI